MSLSRANRADFQDIILIYMLNIAGPMMWPAGTERGSQGVTTVQICTHSLAARIVIILHFLHAFRLKIHLSQGTFAVALMSLFLRPKEKVLRRARRLPGTDGDGV